MSAYLISNFTFIIRKAEILYMYFKVSMLPGLDLQNTILIYYWSQNNSYEQNKDNFIIPLF